MSPTWEATIENDVHTQPKKVPAHGPDTFRAAFAVLLPPLEHHGARRFAAEQLHHPFVERETHRAMFLRKAASYRRLTSTDRPADDVNGGHSARAYTASLEGTT